MKKLIIEQLTEGFLFIYEDDKRYAVSEGKLSERLKAYFGVTKHKPKKEKNKIAPPAKVSEATKPETHGSKTAGLHPAGATSQSQSTEQLQKQPDIEGINKGELHPSDLKISRFDYDLLAKAQIYKSLEFLELPDGRVVLKYGGARYYSTKDLVLQIPFPFPKGHFSKENDWSSSVEQAFKMYRRYLAEQQQKDKEQQKQQQVEKQAEKNTDDWKFKPMLKKDTKGDHGEDYEKIEGTLGY